MDTVDSSLRVRGSHSVDASLVSLLPSKARWGVRRRALIVALVCSLVASLLFGLPSPAAAVAPNGAVLPNVASVPVSPVVAQVDNTPSQVDAAAVRSAPVVTWPSGGVGDVRQCYPVFVVNVRE
jgi:hypothetical protein